METQKNYETSYDKREVCRNCNGEGRVFRMPDADEARTGLWKQCPVCQGRGIVKKHYHVEITIGPIEEDK